MCGIIGSVLFNKQDNNDIVNLKKAINSLEHRGPDSQSYHIMNNVGFGHTRLSIIDLVSESSSQPKICNNKMLIYNGEIYNYKYLSNILTQEKIFHNPNSDTDILFKCILEWGVKKTLNKIDGMYAFAYWDGEKLWLVRDKVGEKFLYWTINEYGIFFSSEIKGIFKLNTNIKKNVNTKKINEYFYSNFISGQSTIYSDIYSIEPGNLLIYDYKDKKIQNHEYWNLVDTFKNNENYENNLKEKFDFEFKQALNSRFIADVDVGILGSGGIDSQSIIQHFSSSNSYLNIFFANNNEVQNIEKILLDECLDMQINKNTDINFNFNQIDHNLNNYLSSLIECSKFFDEPIVYVSTPQSYQISKLAKSINSKVLLSGEGADEIFFGYSRMIRTLNKLGTLKNFKEIFNVLYYGSNNDTDLINTLFINKPDNIQESHIYSFFEKYKDYDKNFLILLFSQKYRLQTHLNRLDISGSMNSIEYRCPFLSPQFLTFINSLSIDHKYNENNKTTKVILRKYLQNKIPKNTLSRKDKNGWYVNILSLIISKDKIIKNFIYELVNHNSSFSKNYLDYNIVSKILDDQFYNNSDYTNLIWNIINIELWFKNSFNHE